MKKTVEMALIGLLYAGLPPVSQAGEAATNNPPDWSSFRYGLYIHFDISTFGGYAGAQDLGKVPAERFAPTALDVRSWARAAKRAGMSFAVLTAKHEAGFCLWDSKNYDYDVASSPVKKDLVAEFVAACKAEGLAPGVHYSIPDAYNEGAVRFQGPVGQSYFNVIKRHVAELHTSQPDLRVQVFDGMERLSPGQRDELYKLVKRLNPSCVILGATKENLGPAYEGDTVIKDWLWSPNTQLTPTAQLYGKYLQSVEKGRSFLLNVGPDRTGRIPPEQIAVLMQMKSLIEREPSGGPVAKGTPSKPAAAERAEQGSKQLGLFIHWGD
jgi:alpha-L-fucosidase